MTSEQSAAYIMAQSACVIAKVAAMQAENSALTAKGAPARYTSRDFDSLIVQYSIHHNAVLGVFAS